MGQEVELWVLRVAAFSSQYDSNGWSASKVVGPPVVFPQYGDIQGAWAPGSIDNAQYLELEFAEHLFIKSIHIYETYNAGGVHRVSAKRPDGSWQTLWSGAPTALQQSRIFSPVISCTAFKTNQIRLDVDCSVCGTWAEIDSVQIIGIKQHSEPPPLEKLPLDLEKLVNSDLFSDVTLLVDGKMFHAHRAILATRCDYFHAMFTTNMREKSTRNPIEIKGDIRSDVFLAVLHYLYTNTVPSDLSCDMLTSVWRVADQFNIDGLKDLATYKVEQSLNTDNVVKVYTEATSQLPIIEKIQEMCLNYISNNVHAVSQSPAFVDLPQGIMLEIIQRATAGLKL
ncbi:hypothetical protein ScPMuIL_003523 [Solemya velum]